MTSQNLVLKFKMFMTEKRFILLIVIIIAVQIKAQPTEWKIFSTKNSGVFNPQIISMAVDKIGSIWSMMKSGDILKYDEKQWINIDLQISGIPKSSLKKIVIDKYNHKWFLTNGYGLAKFDGTDWTIYNKSNSGIKDNITNALAFDSLGNIWIGTEENGLIKFDGSNWIQYRTGNSDIPENKITAIEIDKYNIKWIGTWWSGGVAKFNDTSWVVYNRTNSGLEHFINDIHSDRNNNIWIANQSGISRISNNVWSHYFYTQAAIFKTIAEDSKGNIWAGYDRSPTYNKFSFMYHDGIQWISFSKDTIGSIPIVEIEVIAVNDSDIYFGTYDRGVIKFNSNNFTLYDKINTGIQNDYVKAVAYDKSGNILIGTYGSGIVFHKSDKNTTSWR
ncbi:MAG: hypothetical protein FJ213_13435, partial [Ignavibacteria bacterium]|nr:hypothetical protein [Ignavibacteria bacterium]